MGVAVDGPVATLVKLWFGLYPCTRTRSYEERCRRIDDGVAGS